MGICPVGLFDAFSREAFELYNAIKDGQGWPWDGGFYGQPHVFHVAAQIISGEFTLIHKERERQAENGAGTT